jgi:hypothetical protein
VSGRQLTAAELEMLESMLNDAIEHAEQRGLDAEAITERAQLRIKALNQLWREAIADAARGEG